MYNLSLRGASAENPGVYTAEELYNRLWREEGKWRTIRRAGLHDACEGPRNWDDTPEPENSIPPPVCRQIYAESVAPAWRTTTFAFFDDAALGWFAKLVPESKLRLVTQITLVGLGFHHSSQWDE